MLGHGPLASRPLAGTPNPTGAGWGALTLLGQSVTLRRSLRLAADDRELTLSGQDVRFTTGFSQGALNRVILVGTTANQGFGFNMISDFTMVAGDTKTLVVTVKDASGNTVNISGASITWKASRSLRKASVLSKSVNSGITITDGPRGQFSVSLLPADTDDLRGSYYHEAQVTASDGTISTVLRGSMKVDRALITA